MRARLETEIAAGDSPEVIARAAELLLAGELVAFPTETVYGLGADATLAGAVAKIYEAKGRPARNPLIVHVLGGDEARELVTRFPPSAEKLVAAFWPGPLTLVLPRSGAIPAIVAGGGDTLAVRAPRHPVARALLAAAKRPIAAPSANRSSAISPTRAEHVLAELGGLIPLILDGGPCEVGLESTVLSLAGDDPVVLRPGGVTPSAIAAVLGRGVSVLTSPVPPGALPSPGLLDRHYAPARPLILLDAWPELEPADGIAILARGDEPLPAQLAESPLLRRLPSDAEGFARELYDALRWADAQASRGIWVRRTPDGEAWAAVRDRLDRASVRRQ